MQQGADVGHILAGNISVMHISAEHGLIAAVTALVETEMGRKCCGIKTNEGNLPVHLAAMAGHRRIVGILLPHTLGIKVDAAGSVYTSTTSVDEVMIDGADRMRIWNERAEDERLKAKALIDLQCGGSSPASTFQVESTSPAVSPEAEVESGNLSLKSLFGFISC